MKFVQLFNSKYGKGVLWMKVILLLIKFNCIYYLPEESVLFLLTANFDSCQWDQ